MTFTDRQHREWMKFNEIDFTNIQFLFYLLREKKFNSISFIHNMHEVEHFSICSKIYKLSTKVCVCVCVFISNLNLNIKFLTIIELWICFDFDFDYV